MNHPRVLHVVTHLALGGAERVALDLAQRLRERFEPAIFAVQGVGADALAADMQRELADARIPLFCGSKLPLKAGGLLFAGVSAGRAVRAFRPDLVHLHTEIPEASCAVATTLWPAMRRIALVRTIHNSVYWASWPRLGRWCDRRLAHAHVAGVSADALAAFAALRAASGVPAPPAPPTLIFNGVNVPDIARAPRATSAGPIRVLFAGRFEPQKGADLLPAILAQTRVPANRLVELSLFGQGAGEAELRALAARPPAGWMVHLHAPRAGLAREMPGFDLVIMPSRFEGLSLVALEAALLGVPLVATDAPGLREQLPPEHPWRARAGDAGDFARVLGRALAQHERWAEVATRAREFARANFDFARTAEAYAQLYAAALRRG